jgi:hypothetical protein
VACSLDTITVGVGAIRATEDTRARDVIGHQRTSMVGGAKTEDTAAARLGGWRWLGVVLVGGGGWSGGGRCRWCDGVVLVVCRWCLSLVCRVLHPIHSPKTKTFWAQSLL